MITIQFIFHKIHSSQKDFVISYQNFTSQMQQFRLKYFALTTLHVS